MSVNDEIATAEAGVATLLEPETTEHIELARRLTQAASDALEVLSEMPTALEPTALHATAIVVTRLVNDLQSCVHLVRRGYVMQALSLTAGMLELGHVVGFLAADEERARRWFEHDDSTRTYPRLRDAIRATAESMGVPEEAATREYAGIYREMCLAKHGNPIALGQVGLTMEAGAVYLHLGPYLAPAVVRAGRAALWYAIRYVWIATTLFSKYHVKGERSVEVWKQLAEIAEVQQRLARIDRERFPPQSNGEEGSGQMNNETPQSASDGPQLVRMPTASVQSTRHPDGDPTGVDDDTIDTSPFFAYLNTARGHEVTTRILGMIDDVKKATLSHSASHVRLEKWQQISIVVLVVIAATVLTVIDKLNPTVAVLFGTLVGYVFGKRAG